jgi:hypothetical protein
MPRNILDSDITAGQTTQTITLLRRVYFKKSNHACIFNSVQYITVTSHLGDVLAISDLGLPLEEQSMKNALGLILLVPVD